MSVTVNLRKVFTLTVFSILAACNGGGSGGGNPGGGGAGGGGGGGGGGGVTGDSIYEIKQGLVTGTVNVYGPIVTGCSTAGDGFFVQVKEGDANYISAEHSGIFVYDPAVNCGVTISEGDRVNITSAGVSVMSSRIMLANGSVSVVSSGEALPAPVVVTTAGAGGTMPTALEAVLVTVQTVTVTGIDLIYNEFTLNGELIVDDYIHLAAPFPSVNNTYSSVTGILFYNLGASKLAPRSQADIVS